MIEQRILEEYLNQLCSWFQKKELTPDFVTQLVSRFDKHGVEDRHLQAIFEKLRNEEKFPSGAKFISVAQSVLSSDPNVHRFDPFYHLTCECGMTFAVRRSDCEIIGGVVNCPNQFYQKCNRSYEAQGIPQLIRDRENEYNQAQQARRDKFGGTKELVNELKKRPDPHTAQPHRMYEVMKANNARILGEKIEPTESETP